ncbi:dTDP-4-dehydrorhamnose reductase [Cupriavidus plantarum]|uniref:dTDP-4-dehydrorhamnose reductase n=1 Tax=Cupriavidus plantarum TaxID=942865 RepID=UPI00339D3143
MLRKAQRAPCILVTGSNGQVGFELRRSLASLGEVVAWDRSACDLRDADGLRAGIRALHPDVIVNAAAWTDVDGAESAVEEAFAVNGVAPGILAEEARALGGLLVHYSTDYVFDGRGETFYRETDDAAPLSVYGRSKLAGEQAVAAAGASAIVLRTSWVAGLHGRNFARQVLSQGLERDALTVVNDQHGAPTTAALIADVTARIIDRAWLHGDRASFPGGVYHLAAAGETSRHGYATEVLRYAAGRGAVLKAGPERVEAVASTRYPQVARRPANSRLDTRKLRETFDIYLPDWRSGVHYLIDQFLK